MKCVKLNDAGKFDNWDPSKLDELENSHLPCSLGDEPLYEDNNVKLWQIALYPRKRLPFRRLNANFSLVSITPGMAITRCGDGSIKMLHLEKGDSVFISLNNEEAVHDLENIGQHVLLFYVTEFSTRINDYLHSVASN